MKTTPHPVFQCCSRKSFCFLGRVFLQVAAAFLVSRTWDGGSSKKHYYQVASLFSTAVVRRKWGALTPRHYSPQSTCLPRVPPPKQQSQLLNIKYSQQINNRTQGIKFHSLSIVFRSCKHQFSWSNIMSNFPPFVLFVTCTMYVNSYLNYYPIFSVPSLHNVEIQNSKLFVQYGCHFKKTYKNSG